MFKDFIKKNVADIKREKEKLSQKKKGADVANFQYKGELEITVTRNNKVVEHHIHN